MADYPVRVTVPADPGQSRLWGIPIVGVWIRAILVIPQAIVLFFTAILVGLLLFISWIPVLLTGRMAGWGYLIFGGYMRLATRTALWAGLINGQYPPFGWRGDHPVGVDFDESEAQNRLWGIPLVGILVRFVLLIPHAIILGLLGILIGFVFLVTWIPVLINGRQADSIVKLVGGFYAWGVRVAAYGLLLTRRYPPFSLDVEPGGTDQGSVIPAPTE